MKTSNRLLLLPFLALLVAPIYFAFYFKDYLLPVPYQHGDRVYLKGEGAWKRDTMAGTYHYIWTDFQGVELDPLKAENVEIIAQESVVGSLELEVARDTLFIRQNAGEGETKFSYEMSETPVRVIAAAKHIKGIEAVGFGRFINFNSQSWVLETREAGTERMLANPLRCEQLDIRLSIGGDAFLEVLASDLNLTITGQRPFPGHSYVVLSGKVSNAFHLDHYNAYLNLESYDLQADTIQLKTNTTYTGESGEINIRPLSYLDAEIAAWMNVVYLGNPEIHKRETSKGRVVNGNFYGLR